MWENYPCKSLLLFFVLWGPRRQTRAKSQSVYHPAQPLPTRYLPGAPFLASLNWVEAGTFPASMNCPYLPGPASEQSLTAGFNPPSEALCQINKL